LANPTKGLFCPCGKNGFSRFLIHLWFKLSHLAQIGQIGLVPLFTIHPQMKKTCLLALLLCSTLQTKAQLCDGYFITGKGSQWQIEMFDRKDRSIGIQTYKILDQSQQGTLTALKVNMVYVDDKAKEISKTDYDVRCNGQQFEIDMRGFLSEEQYKAMGNYTMKTKEAFLLIPHALSAGQSLPDGKFAMEGYQKDTKMMDLLMSFTNRKVIAKETITVPAGTFECYKITYDSEVIIKVLGMGIPMRLKVTEWMAKGKGTIRQETFRNDKPWSYSVLKKIG
jgi:hypothetical protein